ncbi:hypothetical protein [Mammaliicoccus sp. E-M26]|uniref:hypothetical protein n=1 Tax=Mammaliicoccus sp. E-M26 TaxID=2898686 RepID=UPI001EFBFADB|nr:hypothetical protein [Mammaliicoccus sp. E-M26]
MGRIINLEGKTINGIYVIEREGMKNGKATWLCKCHCGKNFSTRGVDLKHNRTKSCGCNITKSIIERSMKHGDCGTRIYTTWKGIKARCFNKNEKAYKYYGARGIGMSEEWKNDYLAFKQWAYDNGYDDALTIDRIDVNGNYEPENCRWVTQKEQNNNTRRTIKITVNGVTKSLKEWCDYLDLNYNTIYRKYRLNENIEEQFSNLLDDMNRSGDNGEN